MDYTILGHGIFILLFVMHRIFRYFWTNFAVIDEQDEPTAHSRPYFKYQRKARAKWINKVAYMIGTDDDWDRR